MAVIPKIGYTQSPSGSILTLIDESDYTTSDITSYLRTVKLYTGFNGTGSLITTLTFGGSNLTISYNITKDQFFSAQLSFTGSPTVSSVFVNFTTRQFELNQLYKKTNNNCGCQCKDCSPTFYGFIYMYLSQVATESGNSGLANNLITSSATWLA